MAPSASMLFLSYHQLRQTAAEATPRNEAADAGGLRLSLLSSVLSIPMFERRREAAAAPAVRERDAGEDIKAASAAANKELEEKFEEALRLSCWSS